MRTVSATVQPLIMVEVIPLIMRNASTRDNNGAHESVADGHSFPWTLPPISVPSAKLQLMDISRRELLSSEWLGTGPPKKVPSKGNRQNRGLLLKADYHRRSKCEFCRGRIQSVNEAGIVRMGDGDGENRKHKNSVQNIVSGYLVINGKDDTDDTYEDSMPVHTSLFVTYLRSDDPLDELGLPCLLKGYVLASMQPYHPTKESCYCQTIDNQCLMTGGTAVYICSPFEVPCDIAVGNIGFVRSKPRDFLHSSLTGAPRSSDIPKLGLRGKDTGTLYSKLSCYDEETIQSLSLRMSSMLATNRWIGTTRHALVKRSEDLKGYESINLELHKFWRKDGNNLDTITSFPVKEGTDVPLLMREEALLVYNRHPASGKSTLVEAVAMNVLKCDAVHVLSAPALIAKYGIDADSAFESILHEMALRCAVTGNVREETQRSKVVPSLCIILDHFESFLMPSQTTGNPYLPVLSGITTHLTRLLSSLKTRNEFPFPAKNLLYNAYESEKSSVGFTLPIGICIVGVMTCVKVSGERSVFQNALDIVGGSRFRVSLPSATTRLAAFMHAFKSCGVELTKDAEMALPKFCATIIDSASGGTFLRIARILKSKVTLTGTSRTATEHDLKMAIMQGLSGDRPSSTANEPSSIHTAFGKSCVDDSFLSVGGNIEAKLALEDALALDPAKQQMLYKFGLKLPTGVLLYGPPGCGKTLLARAVAQLLYRRDKTGTDNNRGTFFSLKASDIVRPEVGGSEKLIASAFDMARQCAPSVLFIDEFQALFGDRGGGGFILGQLSSVLLQCLDDITRWCDADPKSDDQSRFVDAQNRRVVVLGATNAPWMIDKAFLRPGRFDRVVYVGLPNLDDREKILRVHVSKMKLAPKMDEIPPLDEICKSMAEKCPGYSGADLAALCRSAAVQCLSRGEESRGITMKHFSEALHEVNRSSDDVLLKKIMNWMP